MAATLPIPEVRILDVVIFRPEEDGSRKVGLHYAWWDFGVPSKFYVEYVAPPGATAESATNELVQAANDNYEAVHEV